ncbi:MAG: hypothetical protein K0S65_1673 [Labilithrix sp.]|nr:hypothetical protein [Labilithrix sp.]
MNRPLLDIPSMQFVTCVRRLGAATLVLASVLGTFSAAHAAGDLPPTRELVASCPEAANGDAPPRTIPLAGGVISARRVTEGLAWDVRYIVDVDAAFEFRGGALFFAVPLPEGERLLPTQGVSELMVANHVVGLCVAREAIRDRTVSASLLQPIALSADAAAPIGAPVASSGVVQIVETTLGEEARLDVSGRGVLEKHVGFVAAPGIGHDAREEARRLGNVEARIDTSPIYVRGEDVRALGGLSARLVDARARARSGAIGVLLLFAGVVGALLFAARRLRRSATVERADALLASEIDAAARRPRPQRDEEPA